MDIHLKILFSKETKPVTSILTGIVILMSTPLTLDPVAGQVPIGTQEKPPVWGDGVIFGGIADVVLVVAALVLVDIVIDVVVTDDVVGDVVLDDAVGMVVLGNEGTGVDIGVVDIVVEAAIVVIIIDVVVGIEVDVVVGDVDIGGGSTGIPKVADEKSI